MQKVTEAVNEARHPEEPGTGPGVTALVPPRQRRHNRMGRAARAGGDIPKVTDVMSGIVDGQCLAALLLWYAPQGVEWKGEGVCEWTWEGGADKVWLREQQ